MARKIHGRINAKVSAVTLIVGALAAWAVVAGGAPKPCPISFDEAGGIVCPGGTPGKVDIDIRLDDTVVRGDRQLASAAKNRAAAYADIAIDNGGAVTISTFGRSAARGRTLLLLEIPGLQELRLAKRGALEEKARDQVAKALAAWAASTVAQSATDSAPHATGSDILAAFALPGSAPRSKRAPLLRLVLTDGRVEVPGFRLVTVLRKSAGAALDELRKRLPRVDPKARPDGLAIFGVGGTGGLITDEDPALTDALATTHRRLCAELAAACYVTPRL